MCVVGFCVVIVPFGIVVVTGLSVVIVTEIVFISVFNGLLAVVLVIFVVMICVVVH